MGKCNLIKRRGERKLKAILTVLVSPTKTFERIRDEGKHFVLPFIIVLLGAILVFYLSLPLVEYTSELVATPEDVEFALDEGVTKAIVTVTGLLGALIGTAISIFVGGLLLLLINLIARGEAKYMQLVKVALFAGIPGLLQGLLFGILLQFMDPADTMNFNLSLGAFVDPSNVFVHGLANLFNPFVLWGLALMVIGTAVMGRRPVKQVAVWLVGGWLLLRLVGIWFSSLFSGFMV